MRLAIACLLVTITLSAQSAAQSQSPRDAGVKPTIGTGSISGVVVDDAAPPKPVRRAIVTLTGSELKPSRGAVSDDNGRFTIANLPAGRFTLTVTRASFITSVYGAKRPGRPGTAIAVADGQRVEDVTVRVWRGAAIAGVLRDEAGAPVEGIVVTAVPARQVQGRPIQTLSNNGVVTNDLGEFRIFGLEPGAYVVMAKPSAGGGGPMTSMSEAEVDAAIAAIRQKAAPDVSAVPNTAPPAPLKPFAYAPVYFPGTAVLMQATPVTLAAGDERAGLEFSLQRVSAATVEGVVTRPDGQPAVGASVQLTARSSSSVLGGAFGGDSPLTLNATAGADGKFVVTQVTPGDYQILAKGSMQAPQAPSAEGGFVRPVMPMSGSLFAMADASVAGTDVNGLALTLEPALTLTGQITCDGDTLKPIADLTKLRVSMVRPSVLSMRPGTPVSGTTFVGPVNPKADGTFQLTGIVPGTYVLQIMGPGIDPAGWSPYSAKAGDRDLLSGQFDVNRGDSLAGVVVTLSDRHSELSGTLQTSTGAPASDVFVIAYAADRKFWGPGARRVQAVRPGVDGRFVMKDLPAGEYLLGAVTDADEGDWIDAAFLDRLVPASIKIAIGEGEKKVQDLRIGGGSPAR